MRINYVALFDFLQMRLPGGWMSGAVMVSDGQCVCCGDCVMDSVPGRKLYSAVCTECLMYRLQCVWYKDCMKHRLFTEHCASCTECLMDRVSGRGRLSGPPLQFALFALLLLYKSGALALSAKVLPNTHHHNWLCTCLAFLHCEFSNLAQHYNWLRSFLHSLQTLTSKGGCCIIGPRLSTFCLFPLFCH